MEGISILHELDRDFFLVVGRIYYSNKRQKLMDCVQSRSLILSLRAFIACLIIIICHAVWSTHPNQFSNFSPVHSVYQVNMALNPRFAGHRVGKPGGHTIELWVDYVCPYSKIMLDKLCKVYTSKTLIDLL